MATIVVDAMGGDNAPAAVLEGVRLALEARHELKIVLVGTEEVLAGFEAHSRVTQKPVTEVIDMGEHPASAVRTKKDSSIVVGCRLVRDGMADGFYSTGNTGACMAAATLVMGRIKGVSRPAIATLVPTRKSPCVFLDVGANADCKPENLLHFAQMGAAFASIALGINEPRVSLLNIGGEATKGSQLMQDAHTLIAEHVPNFKGNIEGNGVFAGATEVIVTDGFTGNVALKLMEGTGEFFFAEARDAMTSTPLTSLAASVVRPKLRALRQRLSPETYGGAVLLGVEGVAVIGHGYFTAEAISHGIHVAAHAVERRLVEQITAALV